MDYYDEYLDFCREEAQHIWDECGGAMGVLRYLRARAEMSEEDAEAEEDKE